jgi:hypothetical protein
MRGQRIVLEVIKFVYVLIVASMVFLFFCLLLDLFTLLVGGGWNPLLGSWPIFSGTVSAVVYGGFWTVASLVLGVGVVGRVILWDRHPVMLDFLGQPDDRDFV